MRENQLKNTLKAGDVALGTLLWEVRGRGVLHTLAAAGMDFVMICSEHSAYNLETVVELVHQAHAAGLSPVVRIPDLEYEHVTRLLDSGCQSLIAPHIKTGDEVRHFIEMAKYHPQGKRGVAIYLGASTDYEDIDAVLAMAHANANTLLGVIVETAQAVENLDDILQPGLDLALVGTQDLAHSLGFPGEFDRPALRDILGRVRTLCRERGIATAGALTRPDAVQAVIDSGDQYILYGTDLVLLRQAALGAAHALAPFRKQ